ncbi:MAG: S8 family serine peptidase, partial [Candidatus Omnitrophica bacterium]|nr:S8 family serine peptidase [Candidatus Omnitrophota bacterium]
ESLSIFRAINYAVNHGAKVINVSLGAPGISKIEQLAIQRAHDMGVLVVVAAGNTNDDIREFGPSSSKHVLAVGQIDFSGVRSTVSSQGANLALLAPGEQIYSLCSRDTKDIKPSLREFGYYKLDGTSFAAPMVSATASLIWAKNPDLTNDQVRSILLETATDMNDEGWDGMTGAGLLNAAAAMRASADESVTVMITNLRVNTDVRDKAISLDMYGSVRGDVREYYIEVGKGKRADKFETVAGPFRDNIEYKLIDRIDIREHMRGSNHWIIRLRVVGADGQERIASTHFELP